MAEAPTRAAGTVLELLESETEPTGVADLARSLGQHPNTVREHLDALVAAGLASRVARPADGRGRPAWLYSAVFNADLPPGSSEYAGLATALAMQLARTSPSPTQDAAHAGHAWGERLAAPTSPIPRSATAARRGVVDLLGRLGFEPTTDSRARSARLTRCPLLDAAKEQPEVVCAVHLGIVRGMLDTWGAPSEGTELIPFAEPGACRLHLAPPARRLTDG